MYNISVPFPGQYKIWFVLLKDEQPFQGQAYVDYAGSATQTRFLELIDRTDEVPSLNLNLDIST
jgi:hypothetical protein